MKKQHQDQTNQQNKTRKSYKLNRKCKNNENKKIKQIQHSKMRRRSPIKSVVITKKT